MTRIIKFRAWDKERKFMETSVGFQDSDIGRVWKREQYMVDDGSNSGSSEWIPMQFTGLTDKNGKEIYGGDIVKIQGSELTFIGSVEWSDQTSSHGYNIVRGVDVLPLKNYPARINIHGTIVEVIGNIWENGDLLNK